MERSTSPAAVPVCVDTRLLGTQGTGVSTYCRNVIAAVRLTRHPLFFLHDTASATDRFGRWRAAVTSLTRPVKPSPKAKDDATVLVGRHLYSAAAVHFDIYGRLLRVARGPGQGVMHWTYPVPMRMSGWANIYTVHDLIPMVAPDLSPVNGARLARILRQIARRADRIVTVSEASRQAILRLIDVPAELVVNCYQASATTEYPTATSGLPCGLVKGGYFLHCGTVERRKNLGRLVAAHARSGIALPLVLVGPDGWRPDPALGRIAAPAVIRLPYVPAEMVAALIRHARALCMPSLAEGFGLPVLEAMAAGTPVITSNDGALAEVSGDAALLVDPLDIDALAEALTRLARDDGLRDELGRRGRTRSEEFSLARFALRLDRVYTDAAARRRVEVRS